MEALGGTEEEKRGEDNDTELNEQNAGNFPPQGFFEQVSVLLGKTAFSQREKVIPAKAGIPFSFLEDKQEMGRQSSLA